MHNVKAITDYRMSKITCIKFSTIIENSLSGPQLMNFWNINKRNYVNQKCKQLLQFISYEIDGMIAF